jgi:hypothetical protein
VAYCIDSNTFIEAKNRYYGLDFCPAFWSWLDRQAEADAVICIRSIYDEIAAGGDELAAWIRERNGHKWLHRVDAMETQEAYRAVVAHVEGRRGEVRDEAIDRFMAKADPWLIAYSLAHGHTVATHERSAPHAQNSVKIPDVCNALGVPVVEPFAMLRTLNARFVLEAA